MRATHIQLAGRDAGGGGVCRRVAWSWRASNFGHGDHGGDGFVGPDEFGLFLQLLRGALEGLCARDGSSAGAYNETSYKMPQSPDPS